MDDDDFPQFGNAFPSASPQPPAPATSSDRATAATWNPALREDSEAHPPTSAPAAHPHVDDDDDFFDRYPDATPKKSQPQPPPQPPSPAPAGDDPEGGVSRAEDEDAEAAVDLDRRHSISVEHVVDVRKSQASPEDRVKGAHHEANIEGPWHAEAEADADEEEEEEDDEEEGGRGSAENAQPQAIQQDIGNEDEESAVFPRGADETIREQTQDLENFQPSAAPAQATQTLDDVVQQTDHTSAQPEPHIEAPESELLAAEKEEHPEVKYEHQGAVPAMEAAQDEEPNAPLLDDEEAPPTPGKVSREPTLANEDMRNGYDGSAGEASPQQGFSPSKAHGKEGIERSFTTDFTAMPSVAPEEGAHTQTISEEPSNHDDWPAAGDDRTFGELLGGGGDASQSQAAPRERPRSNHEPPPAATDWPASGDGDEALSEILGNTSGSSPEREAQTDVAAQGLGDVSAPDGAAESKVSKEDDLAAAWSAALDEDDDDDLLDEGADPAKSFGDDDDLLDDEDDFLGSENADLRAQQQQPQHQQPPSTTQQRASSGPATARAYTPQQTPASNPSPYTPSTPSFTALQNPLHGRAGGTPDTGLGLYDLYSQSIPPPTATPQQQQQQQQQAQQQQSAHRPDLHQATSFADKSKGGYQSPYDLPMEVVKPRRRPQAAGPTSTSNPTPTSQPPQHPGPPPRTSSFGAVPPATRGTPVVTDAPGVPGAPPPSAAQPPPPATSTSAASGGTGGVGSRPPSGAGAKTGTPAGGSGFFEDLPVAPKPRVRAAGAFTPGASRPGTGAGSGGGMAPPPPPPSSSMQGRVGGAQPPPATPSQQQQQQSAAYGGLRRPERMPLLPDQGVPPPQQPAQVPSPPSAPAGPPATNRYSPAPNAGVPTAAASRYSPAPSALQQPQEQQQPAPAALGAGFAPAPPPAAAGRYSPAPPVQAQQQQQQGPPQHQPPRRQMSSGPAANRQMPFAPRTSSPLAWSADKDKPHPPLPAEAAVQGLMSPPRMNGTAAAVPDGGPSPEKTASRYEPIEGPGRGQEGYLGSPPATGQALPSPPGPPRPRTQSPGATMKQPRLAMPGIERPSSAAGLSYAPVPQPAYPPPVQPAHPPPTTRPTGPALPHRRQFSRDLSFAVPGDERGQDPLERWKGGPIFHWSAGGTLVSSFPTQTPYYAAGHGIPQLKVTAGDVKLQEANAVVPLPEREGRFPGPLAARGKGRKKEVLGWLAGKVQALERESESARVDYAMPAEVRVQAEEKLVLWRVMRLFVEHDGALEGKAGVEEEVRRILLPDLEQMEKVMDLQSPVSASAGPQAEAVDKTVLVQIRQALLESQRERAVWLAEEKKLWGHAMLLASTMGPETWKQIVAAFVRSQVKSAGADARSLAALYQVFAGNAEECVDELVPPSARAGFQMVSRTDGVASGNALVGLDQWRETLGLVVGNRTAGDGASLVALGKLLASYGRVEAAHTCFLFARSFVKHSGADDAEAHFVLLGANHDPAAGGEGSPIGTDLDSILLTEIYEWAASLSAPSTGVAYLPHLQSYKLLHAHTLAAHGFKTKAQAYCDHITAAFTSTTRPSQYYHPTFTTAVADLAAFLAQAPQDGKGGLFSRPAMKTMSSGAASWFTKFVAGEDENAPGDGGAAAVGSGGPMAMATPGQDGTPFGRVSGELSRSGSVADLYNPMMMGGMPQASTPGGGPYAPSAQGAGGRYAPGNPMEALSGAGAMPAQGPSGRYAPHAGGQQTPSPAMMGTSPQPLHQQDNSMPPPTSTLGVPPMEPPQQRPASAVSARSASGRYAPVTPSNLGPGGLGVPKPEGLNRAASDYAVVYGSAAPSRRGSAQDPGSQGSYEPSPALAQAQNPYAYQPAVPQEPEAEAEGEAADPFAKPPNGDLAAGPGFGAPDEDAEGGGYQPPTSSYEPPSYQPYQPEPDPEDAAPQPRKKGQMDLDDDDDAEMDRRAQALKQQQKREADRQADETFRKAAEADAARDKPGAGGSEGKKGWLSGWFSGSGASSKKDPAPGDPNKPIKAKLGEENSFYYDETLRKWVNKKAGPDAAAQLAAAPTPPPPKGPASRAVSGMSAAAASGPPSRVGSAASMMMMPPASSPRPGTSGSSAGGAPGSGPPSRAGTPAMMAGGEEGANGDATAAAGAGGSGPPSRPATGMSQASSLDDLLAGGPPARKAGGTMKGKKKGAGRYVDVMAK